MSWKRQYSIAMAAGILIGSIIALMIGNKLTAILAATVAAGITTWICSLDWIRIGEFIQRLVNKMNFQGAGLSLGEFFEPLIIIVKRAGQRISKEIPAEFKKSLVFRKNLASYLLLFLLGVVDLWIVIIWLVQVKNVTVSGFVMIFAAVVSTVCIAVSIILGVIGVAFGCFVFCYLLFAKDGMKYDDTIIPAKDSSDHVLFGWIVAAENDNRSALSSMLYMLWIRSINAIKILIFPFVFVLWGFVYLASYRTVLSSYLAMILTAIHISISYYSHWLAWTNTNFWLATAVVVMGGLWLGRYVEKRTNLNLLARPWPKIKFFEHLPKNVSTPA